MSFIESLGKGAWILRCLESVFGTEKPRDAFQWIQEETKIDCLQPEGVSSDRLVFHGFGYRKCLSSRGFGLNIFLPGGRILFTECPVRDLGGPCRLRTLMSERFVGRGVPPSVC